MTNEMKHEAIERCVKKTEAIPLALSQAFLSDWQKSLKTSLQKFASIHLRFIKESEVLIQSNRLSEKLPSLLEGILQDQIDWLPALQSATQEASQNGLIADGVKHLKRGSGLPFRWNRLPMPARKSRTIAINNF